MGIFDMISSFLNPQRGYQQAGGQLQKYYNQGQGFLSPYRQQGLDQYQRLMQQANALNDPAALQAQWAKSYQTSPQAQQALAQAQQTGQEEASRMGLMGSSAALGNIQQNAATIQQQDRQQYMNDLMQKYMTSIGLGQSLYGTGANAAGAMGQNAMGMGGAQAGAAYNQANAPGQQFGNILSFLTNAGINWANGRPQQWQQQGRMY